MTDGGRALPDHEGGRVAPGGGAPVVTWQRNTRLPGQPCRELVTGAFRGTVSLRRPDRRSTGGSTSNIRRASDSRGARSDARQIRHRLHQGHHRPHQVPCGDAGSQLTELIRAERLAFIDLLQSLDEEDRRNPFSVLSLDGGGCRQPPCLGRSRGPARDEPRRHPRRFQNQPHDHRPGAAVERPRTSSDTRTAQAERRERRKAPGHATTRRTHRCSRARARRAGSLGFVADWTLGTRWPAANAKGGNPRKRLRGVPGGDRCRPGLGRR